MVHAAGAALAPMVVGSVALAEAATPPPHTDTWLVTLAGAFAATLTVPEGGGSWRGSTPPGFRSRRWWPGRPRSPEPPRLPRSPRPGWSRWPERLPPR